MFYPDYSNKRTLQLSNDAFWYLYMGEEPIDTDNLEEAAEVMAMFPNGYEIEEGWEEIDDEGLIEAVFIPYKAEASRYDLKHVLSKYLELHLTWLDDTHTKATVMDYYPATGKSELYGTVDIKSTPKGLKYFEKGTLGKGDYSRFYLKHFSQA